MTTEASSNKVHKICVCRKGPRDSMWAEYHVCGSEFVALDEDGKEISRHFCSDEAWARHDLIMPGTMHQETYRARYPGGYVLEEHLLVEVEQMLEVLKERKEDHEHDHSVGSEEKVQGNWL